MRAADGRMVGAAMRDFSLDMLRHLLRTFLESGYQIARFQGYWQDQASYDNREGVVLLRHDVDRFPSTALLTARLEAELGVFGTYFFRTVPWVMKPTIIRQVADLGHEIGYHYETLADAKGDAELAASLFSSNLQALRCYYPVVSAAMHSRALSRYDNLAFWKYRDTSEFGIKGETYLDVDHSLYAYLADSGRNWGGDRLVVWDRVEGIDVPHIRNSGELSDLIAGRRFERIQLLLHPNRWRASLPGWSLELGADCGLNLVKRLINIAKRAETVPG